MEKHSQNIYENIESSEEICKKYKLPEEQHKKISRSINKIMLFKKEPVTNPVAIIDIAPPGSGKTGLNGMALKQFTNSNAVIINSDELKPFHPKIDEIAKKYPKYYTKITNQESNPWTDNLFEKAVERNYNIIFEGTGRNLKLLQKMINKMSNYKIIVRGMAVNELNCLMSIIERYEGQVNEKGWGRLVTIEHFYKAYEEMLDTIEKIESLNIANCVEIYMRGDTPSQPIKIYSSNTREFPNARLAVISGRKNDMLTAHSYYENTFNKQHLTNDEFIEEFEIFQQINDLYINNKKKDTQIEL